jgi:nucleoside phosphorylase
MEARAVRSLFDCPWDDGPAPNKVQGDPNVYSMGAIGNHNVVLVYLPGGGKANAAYGASFLRTSFPNIKLVLLVGTCGAVPLIPDSHEQVAMGDVVISEGVVQHDAGRQFPTKYERDPDLLSSLGRPKPEVRGLIAKLRGWRYIEMIKQDIADHMADLHQKSRSEVGLARGRESGGQKVSLHFGLFASGDNVVASGTLRDRLARKEGVVAFETEAAGIWEDFPCVVIKGVFNHADGRGQGEFQQYAAATAASCAKSFLSLWRPLSQGMLGHSPWP